MNSILIRVKLYLSFIILFFDKKTDLDQSTNTKGKKLSHFTCERVIWFVNFHLFLILFEQIHEKHIFIDIFRHFQIHQTFRNQSKNFNELLIRNNKILCNVASIKNYSN